MKLPLLFHVHTNGNIKFPLIRHLLVPAFSAHTHLVFCFLAGQPGEEMATLGAEQLRNERVYPSKLLSCCWVSPPEVTDSSVTHVSCFSLFDQWSFFNCSTSHRLEISGERLRFSRQERLPTSGWVQQEPHRLTAKQQELNTPLNSTFSPCLLLTQTLWVLPVKHSVLLQIFAVYESVSFHTAVLLKIP